MSSVALLVSILALCASVAAIGIGFHQAQVDRQSADATAVRQVTLDKSLLLMDQCRIQLVDALQSLFDAVLECGRAADEIVATLDMGVGPNPDEKPAASLLLVVRQLHSTIHREGWGIWRLPEVVGLLFRPFPVSQLLSSVVIDARFAVERAVSELGSAVVEYANAGGQADAGRLRHVADVAHRVGSYCEFLMSLRFALEICYQNTVLRQQHPDDFNDGPYIQVVDGIWYTTNEWLPMLDWEYSGDAASRRDAGGDSAH